MATTLTAAVNAGNPLVYSAPTTTSAVDPATWGPDEAICAGFYDPVSSYACTDRQGRPTLFVELPEYGLFARALSDGTLGSPPSKGGTGIQHFTAAGEVLEIIGLDELTGATFVHEDFDFHELVELSEGPWAGAWAVITLASDFVDGKRVEAPGIVVFDPVTRAVLWDWSAHGVLGDDVSVDETMLPYSRDGLIPDGEWLHANALVHGVDGAGVDHFWVSLCYQDWIIRVDAPSGAIRWRLGYEGDFELVEDIDAAVPVRVHDDQWMFHQHAPEWKRRPDGRVELLVFDNGNVRPDDAGQPYAGTFSRAVQLLIDEDTMRASPMWSYGEEAPSPQHFFAEYSGDVDRHADDSGVTVFVSEYPPRAIDVLFDGTVRWSQEFTGNDGMYRVEVYPSLYELGWWSATGW